MNIYVNQKEYTLLKEMIRWNKKHRTNARANYPPELHQTMIKLQEEDDAIINGFKGKLERARSKA